jgi:hypothetical protein
MIPTLAAAAVLAGAGVDRLAAAEKDVYSAAIHAGRLLCVYVGGDVGAWDAKTGAFDREAAARLSRPGLTHIAADGDALWAIDVRSVLYRWSAKDRAWERAAAFDAGHSWPAGLVVVGRTPFVVLPTKVADPLGRREFAAPRTGLPFGDPPLRILAAHGSESMVWFGTGNGEWGGALYGLDPKTGKWVERTGIGYVTRITHAAGDEVVVSWSQSHFGAHTQVCVHTPDATVKTEHPMLTEKYYQQLAYNPHDRTLYGVEAPDVVTVADGKPTRVASLAGRLFEREAKAIGVAPGVRAVVPLGPGAVAVVLRRGEPWLVRDGRAARLARSQ